MRNALKAHIDKGGDGLSPLFLEAMADYFKGRNHPLQRLPQASPQRLRRTDADRVICNLKRAVT